MPEKQESKDINNTLSNKGRTKFQKPTIEEIRHYCLERGNNVDPNKFFDFYESKGWGVGKAPMKDWKAAVRTWEQRQETGLLQDLNNRKRNPYSSRT